MVEPGKGDEVVFLSGYSIDIRVKRGHLVLSDGIADERRETVIPRASRRVNRIVVHGHSGVVTLDALQWMHDVGIAFVQISHDGELLASGNPHGLTDPIKLRKQIEIRQTDGGLEVMRRVMTQKIQGQLKNFEFLGDWPGERETVEMCLDLLAQARTMKDVADAESLAAQNYWMAWADLPIRFRKSDIPRIPRHWLRFRVRSSSIGFGQMNALDPFNAMLNYGYAILEANTRLAILREGYDPALGFLHTDYRRRHSLVYDLMEVGRPKVDAVVLELLWNREFEVEHFFETTKGVCRLMPTLASLLVAADATPASLLLAL